MMAPQRLLILVAMLAGLAVQGVLLGAISPGAHDTIDWRAIVFEALLFLFVFSWNVTFLPYWKSSKTLCLGSLLFLVGAFTDVHDEFFIQPYWVNLYLEDPSQALGAGLIGLGIWFWAREKEHLLDQLQEQRDFEASLIPKLSHDLRAPLTNLCGMNSVVEEDPTFLEDPKRRQEYHEVMWRGAKEMSLLIDNILESHRLKSGTVELKPSTVALAPLLDEICKDFYYQTKRKEITLVKDCPDSALSLEADPVKVMRIVQNLVANAIRFSPQRGKIALRARAENGHVTVRVADEGLGLDHEQISAIMQDAPVAKKKEAAEDSKGYGIGLKVVKEFVQLHGGRFWVEPNLPRGAVFCFSLPAHRSQQKPK